MVGPGPPCRGDTERQLELGEVKPLSQTPCRVGDSHRSAAESLISRDKTAAPDRGPELPWAHSPGWGAQRGAV